MVSTRQVRTQHELQQASAVVNDEVGMLGTTLHVLLASNVTWLSSSYDQALSNALLNSFLITSRTLFHFLYSHNPRPGDVIAEDFFDDDDVWRTVRPAGPPEFHDGSYVQRVSQHLAHLTWNRVSQGRERWTAFRIAWELCQALDSFVTHVQRDKMNDELPRDVRILTTVLQSTVEAHGGISVVSSAPLFGSGPPSTA